MDVDRQQLLKRLDTAWRSLHGSYAGLSESQLLEPGVTGAWSVRDIIAHVTTWEEEALKHLPAHPRGPQAAAYSVTYGGIDAFNALMTSRSKRPVARPRCSGQLDDIHRPAHRRSSSARPRSVATRDPLSPSPPARYVQPLPEARRGDTQMAGATIRETAGPSEKCGSIDRARRQACREEKGKGEQEIFSLGPFPSPLTPPLTASVSK